MRTVSFVWLGEERFFSPTIKVLAAMASDLNRLSEGLENSLSLASKMNSGGADPVYASTALWHFLRAAGDESITREEAYEQMMGDQVSLIEKSGFRMAYLMSVLPSVDMGKKPEAPAPSRKTKKGRSSK